MGLTNSKGGNCMEAAVAYVGSDQGFYRAIGFEKVYHSECWVKRFEGD